MIEYNRTIYERSLELISGNKLKQIRLFRKLTTKELTIKAGFTDASIRNYELWNRSPTKEQIQKIAQALDCDVSALIDRDPNFIFEIMHIIFDYEKEMKFYPLAENGEPTALLCHNPCFDDFLVEWDEIRKKHYNWEVTNEEFKDWKLSFPKKSRFLKKNK